MNAPHCDLLLRILASPKESLSLTLTDWDTLLRLLRASGLTARLAVNLQQRGLFEDLPAQVQKHLNNAIAPALASRRHLRWELDRIGYAMHHCGFPVVLLKGAAYEAARLAPSQSRICSDVDILVPQKNLAEAEQLLKQCGWRTSSLTPRHERYFRAWLHELPPLEHSKRHTILDVHHSILPRTDPLQVNAAELFERSTITDGGFRILSAEDMVIHSAIHLFRNGDFQRALRDLSDLDLLIRRYCSTEGFGERLVARVAQFGLMSPCFFALDYAQRLFRTPLPDVVNASLRQWRPAWPQPQLMSSLLSRALVPRSLDRIDVGRERAIALLAFWPLPRLRTFLSPLFWSKRLQPMHAAA